MAGSVPMNEMPRWAPLLGSCPEPAYPIFLREILIKAIYLVALIALYFALARTYTEFLQPMFKYMHFKQNYVQTREVESLIVLGVAAAVMPASFRRPSDLFTSLAIVFTLVPTAMMYTYGDIGAETAFGTYLGLAVIFLARRMPIRVGPLQPVYEIVPIALLAGFSLLGVVTTALLMGFEDFSLDLFDVYGRREIGHSVLEGVPKYIVYFGLNSNLLVIIISFVCRRWVSFAVNITMAILFFGFLGNKGPFFGIAFFMVLHFMLKSRYVTLYLIIIFAIVFWSYYLFFMTRENELFASLFAQRMLILPVYVNNLYVNMFSHLKLFWSDSKLTLGMIDYPLNLDPQTAIGYYWLGKTTTHANTGFVGSGYMHAGLIGIVLYAVVIGLCCRLIDEFARQRDTKSFAAFICLPGFLNAVTSGDLPTVLFSGGWSFTILLVAVLDPKIVVSGRKGSTPKRVQEVRPSFTTL
jgi:hypothetical protein